MGWPLWAKKTQNVWIILPLLVGRRSDDLAVSMAFFPRGNPLENGDLKGRWLIVCQNPWANPSFYCVVFNHQSLGRESKASLRNYFLKRQEFAISVSTLMLGQATYEATMVSLIGWRCLQFPGELDDDLKHVGILLKMMCSIEHVFFIFLNMFHSFWWWFEKTYSFCQKQCL